MFFTHIFCFFLLELWFCSQSWHFVFTLFWVQVPALVIFVTNVNNNKISCRTCTVLRSNLWCSSSCVRLTNEKEVLQVIPLGSI